MIFEESYVNFIKYLVKCGQICSFGTIKWYFLKKHFESKALMKLKIIKYFRQTTFTVSNILSYFRQSKKHCLKTVW